MCAVEERSDGLDGDSAVGGGPETGKRLGREQSRWDIRELGGFEERDLDAGVLHVDVACVRTPDCPARAIWPRCAEDELPLPRTKFERLENFAAPDHLREPR